MVTKNINMDVIRSKMPKSIKEESLNLVVDFLKKHRKRYSNKQSIRNSTRLHQYSIGRALEILEKNGKLEILQDGKSKFYKWKNGN